jgi:hypothetical protein
LRRFPAAVGAYDIAAALEDSWAINNIIRRHGRLPLKLIAA